MQPNNLFNFLMIIAILAAVVSFIMYTSKQMPDSNLRQPITKTIITNDPLQVILYTNEYSKLRIFSIEKKDIIKTEVDFISFNMDDKIVIFNGKYLVEPALP